MSEISFKNYELLARKSSAKNIEVAGRYGFQKNAEKKIINDVKAKIDLNGNDSLLDIGCGPGNILIPLSKYCKNSTGIDNTGSISRLSMADRDKRIQTIVGNFLELKLPKASFSKIIIYSVIQYLENDDQVFEFINAALNLLSPGGRLLVGDLPNADKKMRFTNSSFGKKISNEWAKSISIIPQSPSVNALEDKKMVSINDSLILSLIKHGHKLGYETYLLPQPSTLPFGNTREDLLFISHK